MYGFDFSVIPEVDAFLLEIFRNGSNDRVIESDLSPTKYMRVVQVLDFGQVLAEMSPELFCTVPGLKSKPVPSKC